MQRSRNIENDNWVLLHTCIYNKYYSRRSYEIERVSTYKELKKGRCRSDVNIVLSDEVLKKCYKFKRK